MTKVDCVRKTCKYNSPKLDGGECQRKVVRLDYWGRCLDYEERET